MEDVWGRVGGTMSSPWVEMVQREDKGGIRVGKESGAQGRVVTRRPKMAAFGDRREAVKNKVLGTSQDAERLK